MLAELHHELKNKLNRVKDRIESRVTRSKRSYVPRWLIETIEAERVDFEGQMERLRIIGDSHEFSVRDSIESVIREVSAEYCDKDYSHVKLTLSLDDLEKRYNASQPLFEYAISSLLRDSLAYLSDSALEARLQTPYNLCVHAGQFEQFSRYAILFGHDGPPFKNPEDPQSLFWYPLDSGRGSTGFGFEFIGMQLRLLGMYPQGFTDTPDPIRGLLHKPSVSFGIFVP